MIDRVKYLFNFFITVQPDDKEFFRSSKSTNTLSVFRTFKTLIIFQIIHFTPKLNCCWKISILIALWTPDCITFFGKFHPDPLIRPGRQLKVHFFADVGALGTFKIESHWAYSVTWCNSQCESHWRSSSAKISFIKSHSNQSSYNLYHFYE